MSDETIHANKTEFGAGLSERLLDFVGNSTFAKMELEEYDENPTIGETEKFIQAEYGYCYYDMTGEKPVIYGLFVEPHSRGTGKARKLIKMVISAIRDTGYTGDILIEAKPMEKEVDKEHLRRFYESMELVVMEEG